MIADRDGRIDPAAPAAGRHPPDAPPACRPSGGPGPPIGLEEPRAGFEPPWDLTALVFRLQAQLEAQGHAAHEARIASANDRAELHRLLSQHIIDERPQLSAIRARLAALTLCLLAVGAWVLAGPNGLRELMTAFAGEGSLGIDGALALAGLLVPLGAPLYRLLFLRGSPDDRHQSSPE